MLEFLAGFCARATVIITTNVSFGEWATVFGDPKMTATLFDRLTQRCRTLETGAPHSQPRSAEDRVIYAVDPSKFWGPAKIL
jgi:hypothetical protein